MSDSDQERPTSFTIKGSLDWLTFPMRGGTVTGYDLCHVSPDMIPVFDPFTQRQLVMRRNLMVRTCTPKVLSGYDDRKPINLLSNMGDRHKYSEYIVEDTKYEYVYGLYDPSINVVTKVVYHDIPNDYTEYFMGIVSGEMKTIIIGHNVDTKAACMFIMSPKVYNMAINEHGGRGYSEGAGECGILFSEMCAVLGNWKKKSRENWIYRNAYIPKGIDMSNNCLYQMLSAFPEEFEPGIVNRIDMCNLACHAICLERHLNGRYEMRFRVNKYLLYVTKHSIMSLMTVVIGEMSVSIAGGMPEWLSDLHNYARDHIHDYPACALFAMAARIQVKKGKKLPYPANGDPERWCTTMNSYAMQAHEK